MVTYKERRRHKREPADMPIAFIVLLTQASELKRISSKGRIINISEAGIGIETSFPLEPGHVLEWDDAHRQGELHMAIVKWSQKIADSFKAGLLFI